MMVLYVQDNNGELPDCAGVGSRWMTKLSSYYDRKADAASVTVGTADNIYNYDLFKCPTQQKRWSGGAVATYGYNAYFTNRILWSAKDDWRKYDDIVRPSDLPLMCDLDGSDPIYPSRIEVVAGWYMGVEGPHPAAITKYGYEGELARREYDYYGPAPNHNGKCSYLMADFHCESLGLWPWRDHKGTDFHPKRNVKINPRKIP